MQYLMPVTVLIPDSALFHQFTLNSWTRNWNLLTNYEYEAQWNRKLDYKK